jgi:anthranilate synthase component II
VEHLIRLLVIDNHDSFTFTLVDYCRTLGCRVDVVQSDAVTVAQAMTGGHDALLLAPGPGHPSDAGISVALARACIEARRTLLGVCLGQQAIGLACGATIGRVAPVHGKASDVRHDGSGVFSGLSSPIMATRYHSLAITELPGDLVANAWGDDATVQGVRHAGAPVHGVQFHPESIASSHGLALLRNFVGLAA